MEGGYTVLAPADVELGLPQIPLASTIPATGPDSGQMRLVSSVVDPPLMSVRLADILSPATSVLLSPVASEVLPPTAALLVIAVAILYSCTHIPEAAVTTAKNPKVAATATELQSDC